ncbi:MAG: thioesterase family protein [Bacteroidota bacterium]
MDYNFNHSTPIQIRFNDIDIAGHVNNAVHLYYFDYGRMNYFNDLFRETINWREKGLVIVNISVDYLNPIYINDRILVKTKIVKIGNKSVEMIQDICKESDETYIYSRNKTILVGYHYIENYSFPIPDDWKNLINKFESKT